MNFFSFPSSISSSSSSSSQNVLIHELLECRGDAHKSLKRQFSTKRNTFPVALLSVSSSATVSFLVAVGKNSHVSLDKYCKLSPSFAEISGQSVNCDLLFWEELTLRVIFSGSSSAGAKFVEFRFKSLDLLKRWHKALREVGVQSLTTHSQSTYRFLSTPSVCHEIARRSLS